ncbi:AgmX/PglI C-terminal domain-containing protein [Bdellovibrio sp. KM01]|uniref:AgmX/PglI C-terminal domain-containing protein n=1 Tax=Bdellovibrio sp. KM01 TaxID=2748865 RepID=UPI001C66F276|nr:AgmX/PglI C-terminal domain-containing protein [Bdellovibrio sp. KM01]
MLKLIAALLITTPFIANAESNSNKSDIRRVIRTQLHGVTDCYKTALKNKAADEKIEGKVVAGFEIDKDGNVSKSWIVEKSTTLKNEGVKTCVAETVKQWKFPASPSGKVTIVEAYPFNFNMKDYK